ncbi:hypothetical protein BaRGS_00031354 [Batillaria attramentaria]|uniref:Secreted protein n=1 Tax=Batillaria attramentaria TaxID=370345 RepID=A0ABD0JR86_9CAEN
MKVVVLALLCGVALGQMDFQELVGHEVHALLQADSTLSLADCVSKCDDLFPMADDRDEQATDHACHTECTIERWSTSTHTPPAPPSASGREPPPTRWEVRDAIPDEGTTPY